MKQHTDDSNTQHRKHLSAYFVRGAIRLLVWPACFLPESSLKQCIRRLVLRVQHSLPIELAVSRGEIAVQIGTPHTRTVQRFSKTVGPSGRVVVFEAEPRNFERLHTAVDRLQLDNVNLIDAAAWHENGEGQLLTSLHSGDHKVSLATTTIDNDKRPGNKEMRAVPCRFTRIDDALADLGISRINYLSVTVNGAELEVLHGAKNTLQASPDVRVYAKGHALSAMDGKPLNMSIRAWLESQGFITMKTRGERPVASDLVGQRRDGDAYGWKMKSQ